MKIGIGNDHAATELKFAIGDYLKELGHEVVNFGTDTNDSCNYPEYGEKVARAVVAKEVDLGILILFARSHVLQGWQENITMQIFLLLAQELLERNWRKRL